jgi:transcriptional regulator with XRE-family HTH domain
MPKQDLRKRLGDAIRQFRLAASLSPKEFGDDIGQNQYYVLQLEDGTIDVDLLTLEKCADVLGTDISELFFVAVHGGVPLMVALEEVRSQSVS